MQFCTYPAYVLKFIRKPKAFYPQAYNLRSTSLNLKSITLNLKPTTLNLQPKNLRPTT